MPLREAYRRDGSALDAWMWLRSEANSRMDTRGLLIYVWDAVLSFEQKGKDFIDRQQVQRNCSIASMETSEQLL